MRRPRFPLRDVRLGLHAGARSDATRQREATNTSPPTTHCVRNVVGCRLRIDQPDTTASTPIPRPTPSPGGEPSSRARARTRDRDRDRTRAGDRDRSGNRGRDPAE